MSTTNILFVCALLWSKNDPEILCEMIISTGLGDDLDGELWTLFAPTNDAFENLPEGAIETLMNTTDAITDILLFHTIAGLSLNASDLVCGDFQDMANGELTTTVCESGSVYQAGAGNSQTELPEIIVTGIPACNGIVHVIR
jgi:transforming growth factor-beta-induced protein